MLNFAELEKDFRRKCTMHRLIIAPIVIGLFFFLTYKLRGIEYATSFSLGFLFPAVYYLYGSLSANGAFSEECTMNTWDGIRLSSLTAADIAVGKLFGSTWYAWYMGFICLVLSFPNVVVRLGLIEAMIALFLLVSGGVLQYSLALLADLRIVKYGSKRPKLVTLLFILLSIAFYSFIYPLALIDWHHPTRPMSINQLSWYGYSLNFKYFILASVLVFLGWALAGIVRELRAILNARNLVPWVWAGFVLFLMIYFCGFVHNLDLHESLAKKFSTEYLYNFELAIAYAVAASSAFVTLFYECIPLIRYRHLLSAYQSRRWVAVAENIPILWISFVMSIAVGALFIVSMRSTRYFSEVFYFMAGSIGFLARDVVLKLTLDIEPGKENNAGFKLLVYLFLLYTLLPGVVSAVGLSEYLWFFYPWKVNHLTDLSGILLQILLMTWFFLKRLQAVNRLLPNTNSMHD